MPHQRFSQAIFEELSFDSFLKNGDKHTTDTNTETVLDE
jgi:hypothetical protein